MRRFSTLVASLPKHYHDMQLAEAKTLQSKHRKSNCGENNGQRASWLACYTSRHCKSKSIALNRDLLARLDKLHCNSKPQSVGMKEEEKPRTNWFCARCYWMLFGVVVVRCCWLLLWLCSSNDVMQVQWWVTTVCWRCWKSWLLVTFARHRCGFISSSQLTS